MSSAYRLSNNGLDRSSILLGFCVGATCASLLTWCAAVTILQRRRGNNGETNGNTDINATPYSAWWLWKTPDEALSHIGEFPGVRNRRTRWPWDRKQHRSDTMSSNSSSINGDDYQLHDDLLGTSETSKKASSAPLLNGGGSMMASSSSSPEKKSDFCIGSIFGLDVGGTLAKLVYFEQKPEHVTLDCTDHRRERWYRHSASARAVLLARRGNDDFATNNGEADSEQRNGNSPLRERSGSISGNCRLHHSKASNDDLQTMSLLRQESVPDNLAAYAQSTSLMGFYTTDSMDQMSKQQGWQSSLHNASGVNSAATDSAGMS